MKINISARGKMSCYPEIEFFFFFFLILSPDAANKRLRSNNRTDNKARRRNFSKSSIFPPPRRKSQILFLFRLTEAEIAASHTGEKKKKIRKAQFTLKENFHFAAMKKKI